MEKHASFKPGTYLDRWVFRIAHRIWLNDLRSNAIRRAGGLVPVEQVDLPSNAPDTETNIFAREVLESVLRLPEAQRAALLLVYVEGYSYKEAAEMLNIPIGTVMSRLSAGRKNLSGLASENMRQAGE